MHDSKLTALYVHIYVQFRILMIHIVHMYVYRFRNLWLRDVSNQTPPINPLVVRCRNGPTRLVCTGALDVFNVDETAF